MDIHQHWNARLWRELGRIRDIADIAEHTFNEAIFALAAMYAISQRQSAGPFYISELLRSDIGRFLSDTRSSVTETVDLAVKLWDSLSSHFHIPQYGDGQPFRNTGGFLQSVLSTLRAYSETADADWLRAADEVFYRIVGRQPPSAARATAAGVELALNFLPPELRLVDYFLENGELAVRAAEVTGTPVLAARKWYAVANSAMTELRLALHGVKLDRSAGQLDWRDSLMFISHPAHRADRKRSTPPDLNLLGKNRRYSLQRPSVNESAMEALALLVRSEPFELAIAAIPLADSTAVGWRKDLRQELVETGRLYAVIGGLGTKAKDKNVSYWIVAAEPNCCEGTLFINLAPLAREEDADVPDMMAFAAHIVRSACPALGSRLLPPADAGRYRGLLSRYFEPGYRDIPGLCQMYRPWQIRRANWSLKLQEYVLPAAEPEYARRRLDAHLVMDLLQGGRRPARIYIIGANGQGKSMLLAQLADELSGRGISSAGLSFGLTDRFPFNADGQHGSRFTYLGARTSESAVSQEATKRRLDGHVRAILADPARLEAFRSALATLGFGQRLFLIPDGLRARNGLIPDDQLAEIAELAELQPGDTALDSPEKFSLAVLVPDSRPRIVPLEKLSSGEQQLVTFASKLCSTAAPGAVMLVDEPELSLHVSWQRAVPAMLADLSRHFECAFVVATHSPVLIASTLRDDHCFVAKQQVLSPLPHSQVASVESVLFDDFDTYTPNTRRVHEQCAAAVSMAIRQSSSGLASGDGHQKEAALSRLRAAEHPVEKSPAFGLPGRARDLELIRQARAAIEELFSTQAAGLDEAEQE